MRIIVEYDHDEQRDLADRISDALMGHVDRMDLPRGVDVPITTRRGASEVYLSHCSHVAGGNFYGVGTTAEEAVQAAASRVLQWQREYGGEWESATVAAIVDSYNLRDRVLKIEVGTAAREGGLFIDDARNHPSE